MSNADAFTDMARRIEACSPAEFGGALVLVSPDGRRVEFLLTDPSASSNLIAFWGFTKARIEDASAEGMAQSQSGFPPFRR
ncbi:MAG TPA: hypothetical protein VGR84_19040 [Candidatus Acidoferrales bacterium]|nr:hypothetical protein [Candidatus Acidoferrales bacterium]